MNATLFLENTVQHESSFFEVSALKKNYTLNSRQGLFGPRQLIKAVDDISFSVKRSESLGIVGESGCGKSSVAKVILNINPAQAGSIRLNGVELTGLGKGEWKAMRKTIQYIFQDPLGALDPRMTVIDQVMEPLVIHESMNSAQRCKKALALLDSVDLQQHLASKFPHEISGGQRQRVVIARALILEPELLICDEPISALDVSIQAQVVNLLDELRRTRGLTVLFISHDLSVVRHLCNRVAVMYMGRIVELADTEMLYDRPAHPYTRALISAIPVPDPKLKRDVLPLLGEPPSVLNPPSGCRFHPRCSLRKRYLPGIHAGLRTNSRWPLGSLSSCTYGGYPMNPIFFAQKLLRAFVTVFLIVTTVFIVLRLSGDPAIYVLGLEVAPEALDAFREAWGLNKPIWQQYIIFLHNIFHGDFGQSLIEGRNAMSAVLDRMPKTLLLMGVTAIVTFFIGIPAGIYSALHRNSWIDRVTMAMTVASFSLPNFVTGIFLIIIFSVTLGWLPTSGSGTAAHLVLPVITMATAEAAIFARFTRSAMLEELNQPYMRTALAKGLSWHQAVRRHALPNTAIPTVTIAGFFVGSLIAGGVVTENVFAWPGIGRLLVSSVANRDLAVVQVIVMLIAISMVITNLIVDLLYGGLDPRIASLREK